MPCGVIRRRMLCWKILRFPLGSFAQKSVVALPPWGLALPEPLLPGPQFHRGDKGAGGEGKFGLTDGLWGPTGADYGQISEETWAYLHNLYGGGPEIAMRQSVAQLQDPDTLHGEQKIEAETRAL